MSHREKKGKNIYFVTNNCMKTRENYLEKFKKLKIKARLDQVTSLQLMTHS